MKTSKTFWIIQLQEKNECAPAAKSFLFLNSVLFGIQVLWKLDSNKTDNKNEKYCLEAYFSL